MKKLSQFDKITQENEELIHRHKKMTDKLSKVEAENEEMSAKLAYFDLIQEKLNLAKSINEQLSKELSGCKVKFADNLNSLSKDFAESELRNTELQNKLSAITIELTSTKESADKLKLGCIDKIQDELNLAKSKTEQLSKELSDCKVKFAEDEESLSKDFTESEIRNTDLQNKLSATTNELTATKILAEEFKNALKAKTTELTRTKRSEGLLQIEGNKMFVGINLLQSKLSSIMEKYGNYKVDADRYNIVKEALKTVFQTDTKVCQIVSDCEAFNTEDEDEVCDLIKNYIVDSYDEKVCLYKSMSIAKSKIAQLLARKEESIGMFREITERLEKQTKLLKQFKFENEEKKKSEEDLKIVLSNQMDSSKEHLAEVEKMKKEKETTNLINNNLKKELRQMEIQIITKTKITDNLKKELDEFANLLNSRQDENESLKNQNKQTENTNTQLILQLNDENESLKNQNKQTEYTNKQLILELNDANQLLQSLQEQQVSTTKKKEAYLSNIAELISLINSQKEMIQSLQEQQVLTTKEKEETKVKVAELKNEQKEKMKDEQKDVPVVKNQQLKLSQMEKVLISYQEKNDNLIKQQEFLNNKNVQLKCELTEMEKLLTTLQENQNKHEQDCEAKTIQFMKELEESKLHDKEEQLKSKDDKITALKREIEELQNLNDPGKYC